MSQRVIDLLIAMREAQADLAGIAFVSALSLHRTSTRPADEAPADPPAIPTKAEETLRELGPSRRHQVNVPFTLQEVVTLQEKTGTANVVTIVELLRALDGKRFRKCMDAGSLLPDRIERHELTGELVQVAPEGGLNRQAVLRWEGVVTVRGGA